MYVRQSEDVEEGIARGLARCRALVEQRGWSLVETYSDNAVSASKSRAQSDWARLLKDAKAGAFEVLVGVDMDRLLRSIQDLVDLISTGVRVLTVDGEIDLTTADGEFRATMLTAMARFEVQRKAERQKRANEYRTARLGLPVPGKRRFGFEPGNIEERKDEADLVRWAYAEVHAGGSIRSVAQRFGRPPVRVREILTNPAYAGWVVRDGQKFEAAPQVARIVDREVWEDVQALLADPSRRVSPGNARKYLASGIARCGVEGCGAVMKKLSANYICSADTAHACIKASMLDEHLCWEAFSLIASQEVTDSGAVVELARELAELTRKRAAWQEQATWEGADLAAIRKEIARLGKEIARVELELGNARSSSVVEDTINALRSEISDQEGADWWEERWNGLGLDAQRQVLSSLRITVHKGRGIERVDVRPR